MAGYIVTFTDVPEPYSALLKSEKRRLPRKNGVIGFVVTVSSPASGTLKDLSLGLCINPFMSQ